jgi:DNA (cytosine-5)-methyltransferase 1
LTAKACVGILRRAAARGKELPAMLLAALSEVCRRGTTKPSAINSSTTGKSFPSPSEEVIGGGLEVATTLNAHGGGRIDYESETFVAGPLQTNTGPKGHATGGDFNCNQGVDAGHAMRRDQGGEGYCVAFSCKDHGGDARADLSPTIRAGAPPAVAFQSSQSGVREGETHATLDGNNGSRRHNGTVIGLAVRRLTPLECERLQGFPDNYTRVEHNGKPAADGPRYKALGNSMAVPVLAWIGERIRLVDELQRPA